MSDQILPHQGLGSQAGHHDSGGDPLGLLLDKRSFPEHSENPISSEQVFNTKVYLLGDYVEVVTLKRAWGGDEPNPDMEVTRALLKRDKKPSKRRVERLLPRELTETPTRDSGSGRKAASRVRRLAMANDLGYMWTLTHADPEFSDLENAWAEWKLFTLRMRRQEIMPARWIVTPEIQTKRLKTRGEKVWHFHFVTDTRVEHSALTPVWGHGYTWVSPKRDTGEAASYVAKYASKGFGEEGEDRRPGQHRYRSSRGLAFAPPLSLFLSPSDISSGALDDLLHQGGRVITAQSEIREGDNVFGHWYLSTKPKKGGATLSS